MGCSVIWFRRDLRLDDHAALREGCRRGAVLPLFILDPALLVDPETAVARVAFLLASLRALDAELRQRGARLIVKHGDPVEQLLTVVKEVGAERVIAHVDSERILGRRRDAAVNRRLAAEAVPIQWIEPAGSGEGLLSYGNWNRRWQGAMAQPPEPAPARLVLSPAAAALPDPPIPALEQLGLTHDGKPLPPAGSDAAMERLETFCSGAASRSYYWELSYPAARVTSGLSPYLKFGVITARQCLQRLAALASEERGRQRSAVQLASRLRWAAAIQQRFRFLPQLELRCLWDAFEPEGPLELVGDQPELYQAWKEGRTGFPIVDAAARCLAAEGGWLELNFRSRAIAASFLTNLCGIDWRWGALHFMRHLIDGDCPIDHYQWAMQAGVTAAGPGGWARIYHPGQVAVDRCDPQGLFIRRWLPELAALTNDQLGCPPAMAAYPGPVLDYDEARRRRQQTLERQRQAIDDPRRRLARLPAEIGPLFPAALDLESLTPTQWRDLLSWFQGRRSPAPSGPRPGRRRRRQAEGQLSFNLETGPA